MLKVSNRLIAVFVIAFMVFQSYSIASAFISDFKMKKEKEAQIFLGEQLTAKATSSGTVTVGILSFCNIDLVQGWNFISICANTQNKSIKSILDSIDGQYDYVLEWDNALQDFSLYSVYASENPFNEMNENKSYFVYFNPPSGNINVGGNEYDDLNLTLEYKWNDPFYPYIFRANISKYLSTIDPQYEYVLKWNTSIQDFSLYSVYASENPFYFIDMGEGQFISIKNISGAVLRYNKSYLQT